VESGRLLDYFTALLLLLLLNFSSKYSIRKVKKYIRKFKNSFGEKLRGYTSEQPATMQFRIFIFPV
jgi:hypothetical protein